MITTFLPAAACRRHTCRMATITTRRPASPIPADRESITDAHTTICAPGHGVPPFRAVALYLSYPARLTEQVCQSCRLCGFGGAGIKFESDFECHAPGRTHTTEIQALTFESPASDCNAGNQQPLAVEQP